MLSYAHPPIGQQTESKMAVTLDEAQWVVEGSGVAPSRGEFLMALGNTVDLLLPASFSGGKHTARWGQNSDYFNKEKNNNFFFFLSSASPGGCLPSVLAACVASLTTHLHLSL